MIFLKNHFRLVSGTSQVKKADLAREIQNWLREAKTIRSGIRACIQDLHRERVRVETALEKMLRKTHTQKKVHQVLETCS